MHLCKLSSVIEQQLPNANSVTDNDEAYTDEQNILVFLLYLENSQ